MTPFKAIYLFELLDDFRREAAGLHDGGTTDLCQALQNVLEEEHGIIPNLRLREAWDE